MAVSSEKAVRSYLTEFGLNDKEVVIYLTLLKTGPSTIMDLSRKTGIKRSTTHNNVEELIKKGLVSQTNYGERRMAVAEDPEKLKFLLEQRKWDVNKLEKIMPDIVKSIYEIVPGSKETTKVEVKYYEGERGFKEVCQRSISKSTKEVLYLSNLEEWRKVYTTEYGKEYYIPQRLKKNLFLKMLAVDNSQGTEYRNEDKATLRETRFLPKSFTFKPTVIISDEEVSLMVAAEPYKAVVIEDADVAQVFRELFTNLWESNKK
ncbi:MAG: helix-turn-helix domain-containing protein [Candidatus Dojkabacteria bacterium]